MNRFLIIRTGSAGDIIHTLPAFASLRNHFPEAAIAWLVKDTWTEILAMVPGIDRTIILRTDGQGIRLRNLPGELLRVSRAIKNRDQVVLDFEGLIRSGFFAFLSGAKKRIGFQKKNLKEPLASVFYTERTEETPENIHVIRKNLNLLSKIGIHEEKLEFPIFPREEASASLRKKLSRLGFEAGKKLVVFNVGGGWETKRWFPEKWVELINILKNNTVYPLILWGNESEKSLALQVNYHTHVPLVPPLSLEEVVALIKQASLVISGDTFPLHVSCALRVPVVAIFGPTPPQRNGPFRASDKIAYHELSCSSCFKRECPTIECLRKISAEEVAELSSQLLSG